MLVALFAVIAVVVGGLFLNPTVATTDGEAIANDMMAIWNSRTTQDFSDIYAESVVLTKRKPPACRSKRVGAFTETGPLIAFPARVTMDAGSDELMVVLRYDDTGTIVEQHVVWQTS